MLLQKGIYMVDVNITEEFADDTVICNYLMKKSKRSLHWF